MSPRTILLDIEGTTTPIAFVYETLFPYVRDHLTEFLIEHGEEDSTRREIAKLKRENEADQARGLNPPLLSGDSDEADLKSVEAYIRWLMDQDRKSTPLKSLQGRIWHEGYLRGLLLGEVFPDVPRAFERWRSQGKQIGIFSSGSVLAQKLLFDHTTMGSLSRHITAYFDTTVGGKMEQDSYKHIARELNNTPSEILFVSDIVAELEAAQAAGLQTVLSIRPGNRPQPAEGWNVISTFDELLPVERMG
jgi:enolase-phosphatase E1